MVWWQALLFPFAIIYDMITRLRNHLYDIGRIPSFEFETNIVSVGNLAMGGTGKTPMVHFLLNHFINNNLKVATLSRGYGRKSKGVRLANDEDDYLTMGDEPMSFYEKFQNNVAVAVGEQRILAIPEIIFHQPDNHVIVMDDAFQHRSVKPNYSILMTTYHQPFYEDYVVPSGRLRESRSNAKRANAVIVSNCPAGITPAQKRDYRMQIERYAPDAEVFFTAVNYQDPVFFFGDDVKDKVLVLAGIANPERFFEYVSAKYNVLRTVRFRDHHRYTEHEVNGIHKFLKDENAMLICTEKDAVKLRSKPILEDTVCAYVPISVDFLENKEGFIEDLHTHLRVYSRDY
jgi:tetraacyldisaccharide 4'-kinase